jgi:hypothetical protein
MQQISIDFATPNKASIERQIGTLIEYLSEGRTINFIQAREMGIGFLNSRIPNVKEKGYTVYSRRIKIGHIYCKEYSFKPFDNQL